MPFALAEYNAGASRAQRWAGSEQTVAMPAKTFLNNIDFPNTRKYVDSIIAALPFLQKARTDVTPLRGACITAA